jgi:hypothetical protein
MSGMATLNYQHGREAQIEQRKRLRLKWFGPTRAEVWRLLAEEIGANYEKRFWRGDRVIAEVGHWQVALDTVQVDKVTYTRVRAPYVNADDFRFCIFRKHLFSGLAQALGSQDVTVGHREFDEQFIIRGNHESKLRRLFANAELRRLLTAQPRVRFEVRDDEGFFCKKYPEGVDELRFFVPGVIKDIDRLRMLYDLFAETLQELCLMGSAYERNPRVKV